MSAVVAEEELYRSCRLIFGEECKVSWEFLQYLQLSGIKKAYRRKALEFHPDRNSCQNFSLQQSLAYQFIDVHEAYQNLVAYLQARDKGIMPRGPAVHFTARPEGSGSKKAASPGDADHKRFYREKANIYRFKKDNGKAYKPVQDEHPLDPKSLYKGPIPNCQLLFGRYLYYSGIISLHTIGQALIWQRSQRPRLGEIGQRFGWLSEKDTLHILQNRRERQLFGELALSLGILTREQLQLILLQQKKLHKRIGQYFVTKNYWNAYLLEKYITAHRRHNAAVQHHFV